MLVLLLIPIFANLHIIKEPCLSFDKNLSPHLPAPLQLVFPVDHTMPPYSVALSNRLLQVFDARLMLFVDPNPQAFVRIPH